MDNDDVKKELEDLSPFLSKMKENDEGFNVPENYFQNLNAEILSQVDDRETDSQIERSGKTFWELILQVFQPRVQIAFATLLFLVVALLLLQPKQEDCVTLACLSLEEMDDYVFNNLDEYDLELISDEIDEIPSEVSLILNNEEMDDYLDELNLDDIDESELGNW